VIGKNLGSKGNIDTIYIDFELFHFAYVTASGGCDELIGIGPFYDSQPSSCVYKMRM